MGVRIVKMREYYTPAVVLGTNPRNEKDAQIILYTKDLGRVSAIAKSIRKITSKLAGHMKVGALVNVRLVEAGGSYQLIDGLSLKAPCGGGDHLKLVSFLEDVIPQGQPDIQMWYAISEIFDSCTITPRIYRYLLQLMGFVAGSVEVPICRGCKGKSGQVVYFYAPDIIFLCSSCLSRVHIDINDAVPVA
ncbi:MAG: repair protein RecO protein [Parcubacteria group bacterium GW2011_GWB1_43_8b]|nr:MAG: repair protein RecO protein [Parcubacteria group bacterium GW2011_GWB1_43_8b]